MYRSVEDDDNCGRHYEGLPDKGYCNDCVKKEAFVANAVSAPHAMDDNPFAVDRRPLNCVVVEGWSAGHRVGIAGSEVQRSPSNLQTNIGPSMK